MVAAGFFLQSDSRVAKIKSEKIKEKIEKKYESLFKICLYTDNFKENSSSAKKASFFHLTPPYYTSHGSSG